MTTRLPGPDEKIIPYESDGFIDSDREFMPLAIVGPFKTQGEAESVERYIRKTEEGYEVLYGYSIHYHEKPDGTYNAYIRLVPGTSINWIATKGD